LIIVPNNGDDDEAESELRRLSCDEHEREEESELRRLSCDEHEREVESELRSGLSYNGDKGERQRWESDWESEEEAESDWESEGPEGFISRN